MGEVNGVDRISELPEPVIHHIMSFLRSPKDVARTIVLSKKWRKIWASFFTIDFDQRKFLTQEKGGDRNVKFRNYVDNTLVTKLESMAGLQKFKLYLTSFNSSLTPHLTHWFSSAIKKNVKELEIHVEVKKNRVCVLPENVLKAKTLTSLKIYGCKLDHYGVADLPHLKAISIKKTRLTVDIIQSLVRSCPLVEDLRLVHCIGLNGLFIALRLVNCSELKRVEVHECHGLKVIEVDLPNLTNFLYCGKKSWKCKINLGGCQNLRCLTLQWSNMTYELFQDQLSKWPDLEKLALKECNIIERLAILSGKLRRLSIIRCKKLEEAIVDAPNLVSLEYTGDTIPFTSMSFASLLDVKFHFESLRKDKSIVLLMLIGKFNSNEGWKLVASSNKNVFIYEEAIGGQLLISKNLKLEFTKPSTSLGKSVDQLLTSKKFKLELTKSSTKLKKSVDDLLRVSHPKTLSLISSPCSEFLKFLREKMINKEVNPSCCKYYKNKCWLHYLEDVEIVHSETEDKCLVSADGGVESQEIPPCSPNSVSSCTVYWTSFNLKWRPSAEETENKEEEAYHD